MPIPLPPLPQQQKIAQILSTWDQAITTQTQLINAKKEQKRGLMQRLLTGEVRLLGFDEEWEKQPIRAMISESRIPSEDSPADKRLTVKLNLKGVCQREVRGTEKEGATSYFIRKAGQFVYGKQNLHKGALGLIPEELDSYESTSDVPAFDFKKGVNPTWFIMYFSQPNFFMWLENLSTGTGSKRIKPSELFKLKILTPSLKEQTAIAKILTTADQEIALLESRLTELREQKRGLMQRLLTGAVRVTPDA